MEIDASKDVYLFVHGRSDGKGCYHVSSVQMSGTNVQTTKFPDSQYGTFLAELVERISATALL